VFQFTRPAWGATADGRAAGQGERVSIHAPRVGRDKYSNKHGLAFVVSIHAPRVGRDMRLARVTVEHLVSIHAPRVGRDR